MPAALLAFDDVANGASAVASLSSAAFDATGDDRGLAVFVAVADGAPAAPTSVTWDVATPENLSQSDANILSGYYYAGYWTRLAQTPAIDTVTVNFGSTMDDVILVAQSLTGVSAFGTTANGGAQTGSGSGTAEPSETLSGVVADDLCLDGVVYQEASAATPGANQTLRGQASSSAPYQTWGCTSTQAGADGGVMSWTVPGNPVWLHVALRAVGVASGGGATPASRRLRHTIYPVPGPYNPGQFMRRRGSTFQAVVAIAASDTLAPRITDALATIVASLSASDTLAPGVTDTAAIAVVIAASDTLATGITDAVSGVMASLTASDTLAPGVTDALADILATLAVSDVLATGITDTTAEIFATLAASDALDVRIVDAAALLAALSASDTVAPGIADTAAVLVQLSAGDTVAVSISDGALVNILGATLGHMIAIVTIRPALAGDASTDAALGATPDVKPSLGGKPTLH